MEMVHYQCNYNTFFSFSNKQIVLFWISFQPKIIVCILVATFIEMLYFKLKIFPVLISLAKLSYFQHIITVLSFASIKIFLEVPFRVYALGCQQ